MTKLNDFNVSFDTDPAKEALEKVTAAFARMQKAHKVITAAYVSSSKALEEFRQALDRVENTRIAAKIDHRPLGTDQNLSTFYQKFVTIQWLTRIIKKVQYKFKIKRYEKFINRTPSLNWVIYNLRKRAKDSE